MSDTLLSARRVSKKFGGLWALRDITLDVKRGEIRGLIGPNGAGKTTLLNIIAGMIAPTSGSVEFNGETLTGRKPHEVAVLGISRTFQHLALFGGMTVLENVMVGFHYRLQGPVGWRRVPSEATARRAARELLERFGLVKVAEEAIERLSIAERKLVELVRALASKPILLLLDEPAAGLSAGELRSLMHILRSLAQSDGTTIVLVEHIMDLVMGLCDQLTVLDFGEVLADGPPGDIRTDRRVIDAYLGKRSA